MCAQVRLSVVQRKNLRIIVNTGPEVTLFEYTFGVKNKSFVHIAISYS